MLPPPRPTLLPYTTLFRSRSDAFRAAGVSLRGGRKLPPNGPQAYVDKLWRKMRVGGPQRREIKHWRGLRRGRFDYNERSEEHTSELQSPDHIVCRLLLEKK